MALTPGGRKVIKKSILNRDNCDHEWGENISSLYHSQTGRDGACTKCGCIGTQDIKTKNLFWHGS